VVRRHLRALVVRGHLERKPHLRRAQRRRAEAARQSVAAVLIRRLLRPAAELATVIYTMVCFSQQGDVLT